MRYKLIAFGFIIILTSFVVATKVLPDRNFSDMENRYLEQKPELSWESIKSGEYMEKVEKYFADQIAAKDLLVTLKTDFEQILRKKGCNGVYFGKDHQYVKVYEPDQKEYEENLSFIRSFVDEYKDEYKIAVTAAPNVQSIYPECLPKHVVMEDADADMKKAQELFSDIIFVDPTDILTQHKEEYLYFKTDHHWTMRGAYYGYEALAQKMDWNYADLQTYDSQVVSDEFYGSLYSKAPLSWAQEDKVECFSNPSGKYMVSFEDNTNMFSLFAKSNLYKKDKYTYFLDGNHSFLTIRSNAKTGRKALVFKDSYSHTMLPFIADQYDTIDVVDLRYYRENIKDLVANGGYDDILFIYNMDFLTTDENFIWLDME